MVLSVAGGLAVLISAFLVLVWAESRVNLSRAVEQAPHLNDGLGRFRSVDLMPVTWTGGLSFQRPADDPLLEGDFARIRRIAQTCAWTEVRRRPEDPPSYRKKWVEHVPDSALFEQAGHDNIAGVFGSRESVGSVLRVGRYELAEVTDFLGSDVVRPTVDRVKGARSCDEQWAYIAADQRCSADGSAAIGDQRLSFQALEAEDLVTVFGRLDRERITPFRGQVILARGSRSDLMQGLSADRDARMWMFRGLGGLLLWIGLYFIIRPAIDVVAWIPIFGDLARGVATAATMVLAALLTLGFVYRGWGMGFFTHLLGGLVG